MHITKIQDGAQLTLEIDGRLDMVTAPELEKTCLANLENISLLVLDCAKLSYVSSAGLRVLLSLHKAMILQGRMILRQVPAEPLEVLEITGFTDILTLE